MLASNTPPSIVNNPNPTASECPNVKPPCANVTPPNNPACPFASVNKPFPDFLNPPAPLNAVLNNTLLVPTSTPANTPAGIAATLDDTSTDTPLPHINVPPPKTTCAPVANAVPTPSFTPPSATCTVRFTVFATPNVNTPAPRFTSTAPNPATTGEPNTTSLEPTSNVADTPARTFNRADKSVVVADPQRNVDAPSNATVPVVPNPEPLKVNDPPFNTVPPVNVLLPLNATSPDSTATEPAPDIAAATAVAAERWNEITAPDATAIGPLPGAPPEPPFPNCNVPASTRVSKYANEPDNTKVPAPDFAKLNVGKFKSAVYATAAVAFPVSKPNDAPVPKVTRPEFKKLPNCAAVHSPAPPKLNANVVPFPIANAPTPGADTD
jgi:hypothetical protein